MTDPHSTQDSPSDSSGVRSSAQTADSRTPISGPTAHAMVDLTGRQMGDYQVLRRLGRGGMADVYVAQQVSLGRQVAIKVLRADLARDGTYVERFRREARAAARLSHPNIVQVYEVGQDQQLHYIVQEYVDGKNLREKLERDGTLSAAEAVQVLAGVTQALLAASEAAIIHRDIKPENIMLGRRSEVKVADFGLARINGGEPLSDLTQVGLTMGTPKYMSPEQVQGKPLDVRSDLYSLGVTLFHLLAGRPPFEADDPLAMAVKHLHEAPPSLQRFRSQQDLPNWLIKVIERLLEKNPDQRFASPAELAAIIRQAETEGTETASGLVTAKGAPATVALQQALRQSKPGNASRWRFAALLWLLPFLGLIAGAAMALRLPVPDVGKVLRTEQTEVTRMESVEAQFLEAARLDQPSGWEAVWQYFPETDNETNADYAAKSRLQLARLYRQRGEPQQAVANLLEILRPSETKPLYKGLALATLVQEFERRQDAKNAGRYREQLQQVYRVLVDGDPLHLDLFHRKAPSSVVERLSDA